MASLVINGDTSGGITLSAPDVAGSNTQTLVAATGTLAPLISGTAVTASGTAVDFTDIPSWVKRVTVMFSGVSTNGASNYLVQIGAGSIVSGGYSSASSVVGLSTAGTQSSTAGFLIRNNQAAAVVSGAVFLSLLSGNTWIASGMVIDTSVPASYTSGGNVTLSGTLDRIRITTVNGTDTFDAGTINILYE